MTAYRLKVREMVLSQTTPFCKADLIRRLNRKGLDNEGVILDVLNELFDLGIVKFDRANEKGIYAFHVEMPPGTKAP